MEILKWYSTILVAIGVLSNLWLGLTKKDKFKIISFIMLFPILIYLIIKR